MGCNGKRVGLGDDRDLARLAQTSAPARVEHDDPCGAVLAQAPEVRKTGDGLPHGQRRRRASGQPGEALDVVGAEGILVPARLERIAGRRDPLRRFELPEAVQLDHHVHLHADRGADLAQRAQSAFEVARIHRGAAGHLGAPVERPDLHRPDPLLEQALGQRAGPGEEAFEVLVRARVFATTGKSPVVHRLRHARPYIAIARAGVVDVRRGADCPAEQCEEREARGLSEEIPQRDVDRRSAAGLGAASAPADGSGQ